MGCMERKEWVAFMRFNINNQYVLSEFLSYLSFFAIDVSR